METINVMTSCDDNLAIYLLPQIVSIAENLTRYNVNFFLFHDRISSAHIELIRDFIQKYDNIAFHEVIVGNPEDYYEFAAWGGNVSQPSRKAAGAGFKPSFFWPREAYYSMCCHEYLPDYVDRIWYFDAGDIILVDDISEYYFDDFEGKSLIATLHKCKTDADGNRIPYDTDDLFHLDRLLWMSIGAFNSGSYVINVAKFREEKLSLPDYSELLQAVFAIRAQNDFHKKLQILLDAQLISEQLFSRASAGERYYYGDQGLLSLAFVGDIKYFAYNESKKAVYMPYNFVIPEVFLNGPDWYQPKALHLTVKPWKARFSQAAIDMYDFTKFAPDPYKLNRLQLQASDKWWEFCKKTPIYEEVNDKAVAAAREMEAGIKKASEKEDNIPN